MSPGPVIQGSVQLGSQSLQLLWLQGEGERRPQGKGSSELVDWRDSPGPKREVPAGPHESTHGLSPLCQNGPSWCGLARILAGRGCLCPSTDTLVPVKPGLSFPISFWATSPQGRREGEVKTQDEMSLPIEV